jgi:uncharacterized protein
MARYEGPIIDVDIHHRAKNDSEVFSYLPKQWQTYTGGVAPMPLRPPNVTISKLLDNSARLATAFPPDGSPPGSDYEFLRDQLLDTYNYWRGILTHDLGEFGQHLNRYYAVELCRAANEWNIERWLSVDERLYSVIAVPTGSPEEAADEIRRVGQHRKFVSVLIAGNSLGRPLGDPIYHPIFAAAAEMDLSIAVHIAANRPNSQITAAGGALSSGIVGTSQYGQEAMHSVTSLIVHGVFEKFPSLRVIFKEFGAGWLPTIIWGMDRQYEQLKFESPWVKRWPSEYIHDHIRISTQPFEESPKPSAMTELMESVEGMEDILCFSSDYPHLTFDDPTYVAKLIPSAWHEKVFLRNAATVYGWAIPPDLATKSPMRPRTAA